MDNKTFDELKVELLKKFNIAQEQCNKLNSDRSANRRAGRQVGDISLHSAEKKAIQHQAFSKIVNQLSELDNEDKARMAALYLFGYGFAMDESEKYKRIWKASRESSDAQRKRNDLVRKRYIHTKEQNLLLIDFANKTYAARRKGTDALHAENRSMKAEVFLWLDAQPKFKSIEAAAMAITKQQPIAHVTGRDWYKEWKKLRSASTP